MNNEILKNNIEALRDKMPEYIDDIIKECEASDSISNIFIDESAQNEKIVAVLDENNNRMLYLSSRYDSEYAVLKWVNAITDIKYRSVLILLGLSNGLYVRELLNKVGKQNDIIVYEPDKDIFIKVLVNIDITDIIKDKRTHFIIDGVNEINFDKTFVNVLTYERANYSKILFSPNYNLKYGEKLANILIKCESEIKSIEGEESTLYKYGEEMNDNIIRNFELLPRFSSIDILMDELHKIDNYEDITAIVVGAGPSLDDDIDELKKSKGKSIIIAVDAAIKVLLKNDIIPDLVVTVDSHKPINLFEDDRAKNIPLIACMQARYEILINHKAPILLFAAEEVSYNVFKNFDKDLSVLYTGGSVANNAFSLAHIIGFKNIVLVGHDLAFRGNAIHAVGTYEQDRVDIPEHSPYTTVQDIDGNDLTTYVNFKIYKKWFEKRIENMKDFRIINVARGGAVIEGAEIMTLEEVNKELCTKDIVELEKVLKNIPYAFNEEQRKEIVELIKVLSNDGVDYTENFKACIDKYKKLDKLAKLGKAGGPKFKELYQSIELDIRKLKSCVYMSLVEKYAKKEEYAAIKDIFDAEENISDVVSEVHMLSQKGIQLFNAYINANEKVMSNLKAVVDKM